MMRQIFLTVLLMIFSLPVLASEMPAEFPLHCFGMVPIQHEGRIKPLDTFARVTLKSLSGKDHYAGQPATVWLAETLFNPLEAAEQKIFLIENATTRHQLGLEERMKPLYSYAELTTGLGKTVAAVQEASERKASELNADERALLKIHEDALLYTQILRTFSLILPLNVSVPEKFRADLPTNTDGNYSYMDVRKIERDLEEATRAILKRKGEDINTYSDEEKQIALLSYQVSLLGSAADNNQLLRLIPVKWQENPGVWLAPWAVLQEGQGSPETGQLLNIWKKLAASWQGHDETGWREAAQSAYETPLYQAGSADMFWRLPLEYYYNQIDPINLSTFIYALGLLMALAFLISLKPLYAYLAWGSLICGAILHSLAITTRIILLERPPVSTLYESIIFVGVVCVAIGLMIERKLKTGTGFLIAALSGVGIGLLANSFGAEDDTLKMLGAVLNTRFWLATHVLCITFGYGWCVIAALLAHLMLAGKAFRFLHEGRFDAQYTILMHIGLIGLLFTSVGTILGGIWADQSWGRFWGWDPKENGALLIVLWLVWLVHGKLSGHLNQLALLAGFAALNIIVAAAWLGVNLLGVGLHSYGFTQGLFWGLGLFTLLELIMIGSLWLICAKQDRLSAS